MPMRSSILILAVVAFLPFAPFAAGDGTVDVTLEINFGVASAPIYKTCVVTLPEGANVGDALDAAVASSCLLEWTASSDPSFGRWVTSIDHARDAVVTYWAFRVDGEYSATGIDATYPADGQTVRFTHEQWPVPLAL